MVENYDKMAIYLSQMMPEINIQDRNNSLDL